MNIVDKYLIKRFIFPFLYLLMLFIFIYIVADLFENLDQVLKSKTSFLPILKFYLVSVPIIFVQITPLSSLLATLYTLGNMTKHSEITAMRASGLSLNRIVSPFLFLALFISISVFIVNERLVPQALFSLGRIKELQIESSLLKSQPKIINDIAIFGTENRAFFIKKFDASINTMQDLTILQFDEKNRLILKLNAKKAQWQEDKWVVSDGVVFSFDRKGNIIGQPLSFNKRVLKIDEKPQDFLKNEARADFMSYKQLNNYIKRITGAGKSTINRLRVDLYYKRAFPFITIVAVLLGLPFGLIRRSHAFLMGLGTAFIISLLFYAVLSITLALGKAGTLHPFLSAWCANIIFSISAIILFKKIK